MSNKNFGACLKYPWHQHLCMKIPSCDCKATRALFPVLLTIETTWCLDSSPLYWLSKVLNPLKVGGKRIKHSAQMEAIPLSLWKVFPLLYSIFLSFSSSLLVLAPSTSVPSSFVHTLFFLSFFCLAVLGLCCSMGFLQLQCTGFSLQWLLMQSTGSRASGLNGCTTWALECGLSRGDRHSCPPAC